MKNKYKVKIIGKNPKRYIKDLISLKVSIYGMENHDKYSIIIIDDEGLKQINNKKTSYKIKIIKEYGLIKYQKLIEKNALFLIVCIIAILVIILLSNIIFSVEVEHSKSDIRELILNDLDYYGIKKYHFRVSYKKKEKIKKQILAKETNRIEWLEIERIGTKYVIKVEERIKNEPKKNIKAQNIIAKKDAMIVRISATSGEVQKKINDYVKKGDVLISGFIKRDDKVVSKTKADGIVIGEIWYKVNVDLPKKYYEVYKTGNSKNRLEFKIFNQSIFLFNFTNYKTYQTNRRTIIKNNLLPLSFNYTEIVETKEIFKNYNIDNVSKEAIKIASDKLKSKIGKDGVIISKNVLKKTEKDSRIIVEVFFKVEENIKDTENIENVKLEDLEGEENESSN